MGKKLAISLIGASVLAVGLIGGSHKTEAKTNSYNRVIAYVPAGANAETAYDEVTVN